MRTLMLLRHAKSSWDEPALDDFDRPLNERGRAAAPLMARYLLQHELQPDAVLCSSAVRTQATLDLVLSVLGPPAPAITYEDGLYLAPASILLDRVRRAKAEWPCVMMVGHNPGLHDLAVLLASSEGGEPLAAIVAKFPTASLAVFTFASKNWQAIKPHSGTLTHFTTPSRLQKSAGGRAKP